MDASTPSHASAPRTHIVALSASSEARGSVAAMAPPRPRKGRALLVATLGVATVSYVVAGCHKDHAPVGNLAQPVGNLMPVYVDASTPPGDADADAGTDTRGDAGEVTTVPTAPKPPPAPRLPGRRGGDAGGPPRR